MLLWNDDWTTEINIVYQTIPNIRQWTAKTWQNTNSMTFLFEIIVDIQTMHSKKKNTENFQWIRLLFKRKLSSQLKFLTCSIISKIIVQPQIIRNFGVLNTTQFLKNITFSVHISKLPNTWVNNNNDGNFQTWIWYHKEYISLWVYKNIAKTNFFKVSKKFVRVKISLIIVYDVQLL